MNKLQQVAIEHANMKDSYVHASIAKSAFLAGADYAAGAFAEWCSENDWFFWKDAIWVKKGQKDKTTTELYQLWQQSL